MDFQREMARNTLRGQAAMRMIGAPEGSSIPDEATFKSLFGGGAGGGPMNPAGGATPAGPRPWGMRSDGTPMTTAERQMQTPTPEMQQQWRQQEQQHVRNMPAGMPEKNMPIDAMLGAVTDPQQKLAALEYMRKNFADVQDIPLAGRPMSPRQAQASMALKGFRTSGDEAGSRNFAIQYPQQTMAKYGPPPTEQDRANASLYGALPGHQAIDQSVQFSGQLAQNTMPNQQNQVPGMTALSNQGLQGVREFGQGIRVVGGNRDVVDAAAMNRAGYNPQQQADVNWLAGLSEDERMKLMQGQRPALPFTNPPVDPNVARYAGAKGLYTNAQNYGSAQPLQMPGGQTVQPQTLSGNDAGAKAQMMAAQMAGQGMSPVQILQQAQSTGNQELAQLASAALENAGRYGQPGGGGQAGDVRPMPQPVAPQQAAQGAAPSGWNFGTVPKTGVNAARDAMATQVVNDNNITRAFYAKQPAGQGAAKQILGGLNPDDLAWNTGSFGDAVTMGLKTNIEGSMMIGDAAKAYSAIRGGLMKVADPATRAHAALAIKNSPLYKNIEQGIANIDSQGRWPWSESAGKYSRAALSRIKDLVDTYAVVPEAVASAETSAKAAVQKTQPE